MLKILTANRLSDGASVWFSEDGAWRTDLGAVQIARDSDAVAALEQAAAQAVAANFVIDASLMDVQEQEGRLYPLRLRERIRLQGPSIDYGR